VNTNSRSNMCFHVEYKVWRTLMNNCRSKNHSIMFTIKAICSLITTEQCASGTIYVEKLHAP
jgi:hypothetical protein